MSMKQVQEVEMESTDSDIILDHMIEPKIEEAKIHVPKEDLDEIIHNQFENILQRNLHIELNIVKNLEHDANPKSKEIA